MSPISATPLGHSFLPVPPAPNYSRYLLSRCSFRNVSSRRAPATVNMAIRRNTRSSKTKSVSNEASTIDNSTSIIDDERKDEDGAGQQSLMENKSDDFLLEGSESSSATDNSWLFDEDDEEGRTENQLGTDKNFGSLSSKISPLDEEEDDDNDELPTIEDFAGPDDETNMAEEILGIDKSNDENYDDGDDVEGDVSTLGRNIDNIVSLDDEVDGEDEDLAAFDDDSNFGSNVKPFSSGSTQRKLSMSSRRSDMLDPDENDDVEEMDDFFDPAIAEIDYDDSLDAEDASDDADVANEGSGDDFDNESQEDIQSAADILSKRGLLGLGVEKGESDDENSIENFELETDLENENDKDLEVPDDPDAELGLPDVMDDEDEDEDVPEDATDSLENAEEKSDLDDYPDLDEGDNEPGLTSPANIGRIWELNEDSYVTITEPGQSYGYEMDEDDQEDQDMATMRRGKQGGWSGGLASYPSSDLPKGSREWIARRSYELMMKASYIDMFRWAKRHGEPPPEIAALYPDDPPPSMPLGKSILKISAPPAAVTLIGQPEDVDQDLMETPDELESNSDEEPHALDRSIKFPCNYKFKVEGDVGDEFIPSIRATVENVMGSRLPRSALVSEPAGRYQRVTITVEVQSARQVTGLYDALRTNPLVKFSYG